jgi:hypothetical protein
VADRDAVAGIAARRRAEAPRLLRAGRGMVVTREAWQACVDLVRTICSPERILSEHAAEVAGRVSAGRGARRTDRPQRSGAGTCPKVPSSSPSTTVPTRGTPRW